MLERADVSTDKKCKKRDRQIERGKKVRDRQIEIDRYISWRERWLEGGGQERDRQIEVDSRLENKRIYLLGDSWAGVGVEKMKANFSWLVELRCVSRF